MMAFPVLGASLLTGCQESPPAATFNAPAAAPGSHPAPPPTAPAAKGQDKDNLADQQKAMQAENSDGGKAPQ
jgi:hypothetical protein